MCHLSMVHTHTAVPNQFLSRHDNLWGPCRAYFQSQQEASCRLTLLLCFSVTLALKHPDNVHSIPKHGPGLEFISCCAASFVPDAARAL